MNLWIVQRLRQIKNSLENDLMSKKSKSIKQKIQESLLGGIILFPLFLLLADQIKSNQIDLAQNKPTKDRNLVTFEWFRFEYGLLILLSLKILNEIARDAKKRKLTNIRDAYRLLSRNILHVDEKRVGFRFETFYGGGFLQIMEEGRKKKEERKRAHVKILEPRLC